MCMNPTHMMIASAEERFWARVNKAGPVPAACPELGPCWLWTGPVNHGGYGDFFPLQGDHRTTHRYSWELANGRGRKGLYICHRCDNPPCVNPDHLFEGTPLENAADCIAKGRNSRGEKHAAIMRARTRKAS
jgi:hypothetical protein